MGETDLISRQAAIDVVHKVIFDFFDICDDDEESPMTYKDKQLLGVNKDISTQIKALPSAQPEIIRCKDCRWGRETCGNIECFVDLNVPPEYHGYEWFCPNGERRTDEID